MLESGKAVWDINPTGQQLTSTIVSKFSAKKYFNLNKGDIAARDDIGANMGSNPNESPVFVVFAQPMNLATDTPVLNCVATIDYIVELREPKALLQS